MLGNDELDELFVSLWFINVFGFFYFFVFGILDIMEDSNWIFIQCNCAKRSIYDLFVVKLYFFWSWRKNNGIVLKRKY